MELLGAIYVLWVFIHVSNSLMAFTYAYDICFQSENEKERENSREPKNKWFFHDEDRSHGKNCVLKNSMVTWKIGVW